MQKRKILVCVAWPYANGSLHLGHMAGSIMPADIFARYNRMVGNDVLMISGSDMHGAPIAVRADRENTTPEEVAFRFHRINTKALEDIGASFDLFTSTHTDNHTQTVQDIFLKLLGNGYLEKRKSLQFYCPSCQRFLPDRYVEGACPHCGYEKARGDQCDQCGKALNAEELGEARCQLCSAAPSLRETEHFFLALSKFTGRLKEYISDKDHWRGRVRSFTSNLLEEGLEDRAITRDLTWGVPVPVEGFESKRIYVWFEAVIGYLSASKEWASAGKDRSSWETYWKDTETRSYYFIGKDNIIFHTIIWPAILIGYDDTVLPYDVPANEFMNLEGEKFSKSSGVSIDLPDMLRRFQPDAIRYYLSVNMPEGRDTDFSWEDFVAKVNNELVAAYGNFIHRVLSFTQKNFGCIPPADSARQEWISEVESQLKNAAEDYSRAVGGCNFKLGLKTVMELARFGNQFFDSVEPWALLRKDREMCGSALNLSMKIARELAVLAYPYLPFSSEEIWRQIGYADPIEEIGWAALGEDLLTGKKLEKPVPLFKKIEIPEEEPEEDCPSFARLNLKVGRIEEVSDHPDADKLYKLTVDIGRKIGLVAGLKEHYTREELRGKRIVVLTNLEPATIRGVKSEGMLLAAEAKKSLALLAPPDEAPPGMAVNSGRKPSEKLLPFSEFQKLEIRTGTVGDGEVDIGRRMPCSNCKSIPRGGKVACFVENERALVLICDNGSQIGFDRDISAGAKIR
ncbi:MAG TPA: methionine--tRNA ligase [Euryarchaeota archaeon]|nr:methionine--tRNA ligase [Euryarchaeota archaeon]